ncbi:hypothetical protein MSG28_004888 [Choristoneura fumiferana]|uniref:Uncharacterized protein n=1 Tax=Choristoneura fumiferana TaxID=7141 RepID=A0ACC0JNZ5_CHOFU|nr:hypothetical protein MSG28_004888 [Choristoneura fumiferana]
MIADTFNTMKGFRCNIVQLRCRVPAAMPPKASMAESHRRRPRPASLQRLQAEKLGICVVAGSGFGQRPGTYHFRTTILPQPALLQEMLDIFKGFHEKFTKEYA